MKKLRLKSLQPKLKSEKKSKVSDCFSDSAQGEFITSDSAGIRDMPRPPPLRTALALFFRLHRFLHLYFIFVAQVKFWAKQF